LGFEIVSTSPALIDAPVDLYVIHGIAFYDALIVQAATVSGCARLWSEDLQTGRALGKLVIRNPFSGKKLEIDD
jgi:predicted nucleic acid-binding protein